MESFVDAVSRPTDKSYIDSMGGKVWTAIKSSYISVIIIELPSSSSNNVTREEEEEEAEAADDDNDRDLSSFSPSELKAHKNKCKLKQKLNQYDANFMNRHGRMPVHVREKSLFVTFITDDTTPHTLKGYKISLK
ncbi:MAG: hypothetical protein ACI90V_005705 [Bacillariaceae sp.]|jgi:hypothetical protein